MGGSLRVARSCFSLSLQFFLGEFQFEVSLVSFEFCSSASQARLHHWLSSVVLGPEQIGQLLWTPKMLRHCGTSGQCQALLEDETMRDRHSSGATSLV